MEQKSFESNCKTQAIGVGYRIARILFVAMGWLWKWLVKFSIVYQMLRKLFKRFFYVDYLVSGGCNGKIENKEFETVEVLRFVAAFIYWTSRTEGRILFLSNQLWNYESLIRKENVDNIILREWFWLTQLIDEYICENCWIVIEIFLITFRVPKKGICNLRLNTPPPPTRGNFWKESDFDQSKIYMKWNCFH